MEEGKEEGKEEKTKVENPWMPNGVPLVQLPPKPEGMSKNKWKKQLKEKKYFEERESVKEARKIKRIEVRKKRKEMPIEQRKQKIRRQESGFKVLIDLSFDEYMSEKEMKSTAGQLIYSYAAVRTYGLALSLTSISATLDKYLTDKSCDYKYWNVLLSDTHFSTLHKEDFKIDIEPKFCYLTADSGNEIQELDKDTIYVIGGIVDKNRHKNLCLGEANRLKISHARLPISKYIEMQTRKVLTINHVVGILGEFTNSGDWEKSFLNILPSRKGAIPTKNTDEKVGDICLSREKLENSLEQE
jgi:tRNA (guanine9-N1)-methyltransferase